MGTKTAKVWGKVGLPAPVQELASIKWDVIVVGAGHNGLTCAAYLARAGKRVLVLEAQERVGGACTMEELWPGYSISPCAYLAGLLHPLVVDELQMESYGFEWTPATAGLFVPFPDGSSIQMWGDSAKCESEIERFAPGNGKGWRAMGELFRRTRDALRPAGAGDMWIGRAPTREEIEKRLKGESDAINLIFEWSMVDLVERYLDDERLQSAMLGQGVIGTNASPFDAGTASIHFHHSSGRQGGLPGTWGYVKGGMGMVSFILCDIAQDSGAVIATGVPVGKIIPGEGVELGSGEKIAARVVVSNTDPRATARLLGENVDRDWLNRVESIPQEGCTVKVSVALTELPNFVARPGTFETHHLGQINTPLSKEEWQNAYTYARAGHVAPKLWTELYFQSAHDSTVAPAGRHVMSVFAQYVPYHFAQGNWDTHRKEIGEIAIGSIAQFCSNLPGAIEAMEVMGPPDIEEKIGLTGGHIFQGECLPDYMWGQRLQSRTPVEGLYLCGACTHPGGSVIAINGRNAAMEVLAV
jgi:phytoene dehydrogenase-like protein